MPKDIKDYTNQVFENFKVVKEVEPTCYYYENAYDRIRRTFLCICIKCEAEKIIDLNTLKYVKPLCYKCNTIRKKHGYTVRANLGSIESRTYTIWYAIINRCTNTKDKAYAYYGGRGIEVCERWKASFENFIEDVGFRPSHKHSIERINVDGNYEPTNCKWILKTEQSKNKRNSIKILYEGQEVLLTDLAEKYKIPKNVLYYKYKKGKNLEKEIKNIMYEGGNSKNI